MHPPHLLLFPLLLLSLALAPLPILANPLPIPFSLSSPLLSPLPLTTTTIHQFPLATWAENLAVRSNGQILTTLLSAPELYQIDPFSSAPDAAVLVHRFPNASGLLGIAEGQPDVFYVIAGSFSLRTFITTPSSYAVWKVDVRDFSPPARPASVEKITDLPDSGMANGMVLLDPRAGLLLIADSSRGIVWRVDVTTGDAKIVIDDPLMKPTTSPPIGVNGLRIYHRMLYFTNSNAATLNRIPIHADGTPAGRAEVISSEIPGDDFVLDGKGNAFVAELNDQLGFVPRRGGNQTVLVGLKGPTAVQWGRSEVDRERGSLYVSTNGGAAAYLSGNFSGVLGGAVIRVDAGSGWGY
ncbi:MAG: hypothetical protein Q9187_004513 [Circinaria calcarea]